MARPRHTERAGESAESAATQSQAWLLEELHEGAAVVGLAEFRAWALRLLCAATGSAAASWIWGLAAQRRAHLVVTVDASSPPSSSLKELTQRHVQLWLAACRSREHAAAPSAARVLVHAMPEPRSQLDCALVLTRDRAAAAAFGAREAIALQAIAPHFAIAWRNCQLLDLYRRSASALARGAALVDGYGHVHAADRAFYSTLRQCWPDWTGARLPQPLCALLAPDASQRTAILGDFHWRVAFEGDLRYLCAARIGALGKLTARERALALAILSGKSYAQAALSLGISANTLRNGVARVYRKLGVAGKLELAQRVGLVVSPTWLD